MIKHYYPNFKVILVALLISCMGMMSAIAQTTLTTGPFPPYTGTNSLGSGAQVSFVLDNTNAFAVNLTGVGNYMTTADNNSIWKLYYTATELTGSTSNCESGAWSLVATSGATTVTASGITSINFTSLSFSIPANTTYRFALENTGPGSVRYSGTGSSLSPNLNSFTGGGVTLLNGDAQIGGINVGYSGSGTGLTLTPRYYTGSVTFAAAGPCTNPPVTGTISSTAVNACLNEPFTVSLSGGTGGTGQTYQWQISTDNVNFTNITGETNATLSTSQSISHYYRVIVTCGVSVTSSSIFVSTAAAVGGTFTINSAVATGGTNFQSFNDAYNFIKCGINAPVVFNVVGATTDYNEQLIINSVPGASATNTVTFNGNGRTLSFLSTNTNERAVIKLDGADHFTFDSLNITALGSATSEYGFGVQLMNDADSNVISRCNINITTNSTSTNYAGIVMSGSATSAITTGNTLSDRNVFTRNVITGGYYGFTCVGSTTAAISENVFSNNEVRDFYFYGTYLNGNFATIIDSNLYTRPTRATVSTFYGVYATGLSINLQIKRNTFTDPFGGNPTSTSLFAAVYFTGVDALSGFENKVYNNQVYNLTGAGEVSAFYNISSDNVWYQHNTLRIDGVGGTGTQIARGFYQTTAAAGIRFENNIVVLIRGSSGAKYTQYYNTATSDIVANYNDLFLATTVNNTFTGFVGGNAQATLADWRTASLQDANSVANNPLFTNVATGNLQPTNATIDNLGIPVGILTDILGAARSATTPDIGAYEFTPGNCAAPPEAGNAIATPDVVCENSNVSLSVSGNSIGLGQTYQWQSSPTLAGTYTNISGSLTNPVFTIVASTTQYYRVAVTCNSQTDFSVPVLLTVNPAFPGGTYTINSAAPTSGTNYTSFNDAYTALSCGISGPVVFNVLPVGGTATYAEQLIMDSIAGTSAVNTITFNGNGNTIKFSSSVTGERAVIKLRGADHIRFDNLKIDAVGPNLYGWGVQLVNNADSNIINNCIITTDITSTSTNYAGIVISNSETSATTTGNSYCDGNTFSNNTITGGYYGITNVGGTTTTTEPVLNNTIKGNTLQDFYFYGIYSTGTENTVIDSNMISRPTRTSLSTMYGIYLSSRNINTYIIRNRITNPSGGNTSSTSAVYGIYITGVDATNGSQTRVRNNLIYGFNNAGSQYGFYNSSSSNVRYYHNTVSLDDDTYTGSNLTYAFYQITTADQIEVKNNIFSITRGGTGVKYGQYWSTAASTITSDYNDFWIRGTNASIGFSGGAQTTLSDWRTATGGDANSFATNPFFSSPGTGNYSPFSAIIDDKGTPVGVLNDINGAPRSATTPDMGAYEFAVPPCTTPPTAGAAAATPNSGICIGAEIQLSLLGNSIGSGQNYQWQFSTTATGPYTNLGGPISFPDTAILATSTLYYRAIVTCNGNSQNSTPVLVTLNPAFLAGTYTINPALPVSATNFTSIASAVAALDCGITGSVFFDIAAGTYNEQIRMKYVAGVSPSVNVTFRSADGNPASVTLTNAGTSANNYTLLLDSSEYIIWKNMTIAATNASFGRVIELANTAANDSLINLRINAPVSTSTSNVTAGIYATALRGGGNVIKNNIITNGSSGIYFAGSGTTNLTYDNVIDSNTVNGSYYYGMYIQNNGRIKVQKNTVNVTMPSNSTTYGMYSSSADSNYQYVANKINITGMTNTTTYGLYFTGCNGGELLNARIANNTIMGLTGNTSTLYGIYQTASTNNRTVNNVISILSTASSSYGSYLTGGGGVRFHNNTVLNSSTSTAVTNTASYFAQTSGTFAAVNIQNNIFSALGGGRAMYTTNLNFMYSDYNTFYTTGPTLIQWNAGNAYATLQAWRDTSFWDLSSIAVLPSLLSPANPQPDVANPNVWAIHGRGNQVEGNNYDFNNNPRPTTLTTGVPDMGAYEFLPTAAPSILTAIPVVPVAGSSQYFMYGTDTVARVRWRAGAPVPASITMQRYSGVIPPGLAAGQQSMYFYTKANVPTQGAYNYALEQFYVDSWQGFIFNENTNKLGQTEASNAWVVKLGSTVDPVNNVLKDSNLVYFDRFTGLTDGTVPPAPAQVFPVDSSNSGTRFWVGYGHHQSFTSNAQDMVLYLSAQNAANVTVKVNGTSYSKTYAIPANSAIVTVTIPKSGLIDARLTDEGKFNRGISIESDVPIQAYAHIYDGANSGASLLLPVGVYGYEYQSLNFKQYYASNAYSWFFVVADRDSTLLEITPSVLTKGGRPAGVPFQVYLNRGEIYNVMGTTSGSDGSDLSGSKVKAIANASGKCHPFGMFSGSSRTAICFTSNGDNFIQQVFPSQAWGSRFLTFATATSTSNTQYNSNIWRVMVKDPATVVRRNGVPLTGYDPVGKFYEFSSPLGAGPGSASYIQADQPVMMAQYMVSTSANSCPGVNTTGLGDPEMIYISPLEQGIKNAVFYNTNENSITSNYINVIIPTAGLTSLTIDGSSTFTDVFAHPNLAGYSCVRQNIAAAPGQHRIFSDSAFTSITYGLGSVESYGYNAGTLVKNLNGIPGFANTLAGGGFSDYTCVNAPFKISLSIPLRPTAINWRLSQVPGISPNIDIIQNNPVATDSSTVNGRKFYKYELPGTFTFNQAGTFNVPIVISSPSFEGCSNTQETLLNIRVIPAPRANFASNANVCLGSPLTLTGSGTSSNNTPVSTYNWNFGNTTTAVGNPTTVTYTTAGTYNVKLSVVTNDGCIGDTTKAIIVDSLPIARAVSDSVAVCNGSAAVIQVLNPVAGTTYNYYTTATGGTPIATGTSYTVPSVTGTVTYYIGAVTGSGCVSMVRTPVIVRLLPDLVAPNVTTTPVLVCTNSPATFTVANPVSGVTYSWFTAPTGGTAVATGVSFTTPNVADSLVYYVGSSTSAGCVSANRTRVVARLLANLAVPVVVVDSAGIDFITFRWNAVPGAATYEVSTNNGSTWQTPSSGATGLTHTVTNLAPLSSATLIVRANGVISCQRSVSAAVTGRTKTDQIYIPNAFSPNGDGLNDQLLVYGYSIRSLRFIIFNQWGEKVYEATNQAAGWNGTYKGKPQPSGVYMYVCEMILNDGSKQQRKGSINLVR